MIKLVIFDFDYTLEYDKSWQDYALYDNTVEILELLKSNNIFIAIASHNIGGHAIVENLGIKDYFNHIEFYNDNTYKKSHIEKIMAKYPDIKKEEIVFFDDDPQNIQVVRNMGIHCVLVAYTTGVDTDDIHDIINNNKTNKDK